MDNEFFIIVDICPSFFVEAIPHLNQILLYGNFITSYICNLNNILIIVVNFLNIGVIFCVMLDMIIIFGVRVFFIALPPISISKVL